MSEWIKVTEKFPDPMEPVLGICISQCKEYIKWIGIVQVYFIPQSGWSRCELHNSESVYITHWMPLPELPKEI